jgi:hypothetical protein
MHMKNNNKRNACSWIGEGEGCRHPTMFGKSYCERHHDRVYLTFLPEMADYVINKEVESIFRDAT